MFGWVMKLVNAVSYILSANTMLLLLSLVVVHEAHNSDALHEATNGISKEFAPWLQGSIDADLVFGCHEEVAGLGRVVRGLFGDVVTLGSVWVVPPASECLAEDGVEWLLDAPGFTP